MNQDFRRKRPAYGFPFLDAEATHELEEKSRHAQSILSKANYKRVMPPALDFPETFAVFESYDSFRIRDRLGEDLSLRSDVTVQIMKGYANLFRQSQGPQKIYYTVPVYRDIRRSYPSLREVWQVGAEYIGENGAVSLPELLKLATDILSTTFHSSYAFLVSDIRVLGHFEAWLCDESLRGVILQRNAPVFTAILQAKGVHPTTAPELARLLLYPPNEAARFQVGWNKFKQELPGELVQACEVLWQQGQQLVGSLKNPHIRFEPLLSSRTLYYTGLFFEGYVPSLNLPPVRGGAYHDLLREYSEESLPAAGFAVDISSLAGVQ